MPYKLSGKTKFSMASCNTYLSTNYFIPLISAGSVGMTRCSGAAEGSGGLPPMVGGEVLSLGSCLEESSPSMGSSLMTRLPPTVPGSAPASTFELTLLTEDGATEEGGAILAEAGVMVAVTLRLARLLVAPQFMSENKTRY